MAYLPLDLDCANTIRSLTLDAVQKAESGHPGMPLGMADVAYVLYRKFMRFNPRDPDWFNRDRFIISAGHGSLLLYTILHLTGYKDVTIEQLQRFRQWDSLTPGHPENTLTKGVEVTTGPLGAGTSNSVGMALAEAWLAAKFNRDGDNLVDHFTYAIVSDGDLQEGVSHEAAGLAGHLGLGKLLWFYDDNSISIDGPTSLSYSDDVPLRFKAYGWHVQTIDGHDMVSIERAIKRARNVTDKPSIICCKTIIGKGMPTRAGTQKAHSDAPGEDEVHGAKIAFGFDADQHFFISDAVLQAWRKIGKRAAGAQKKWVALRKAFAAKNPDLAMQFSDAVSGHLPAGWDTVLPKFATTDKPMATRAASGAVINALVGTVPTLLGGSADLTPSNNTMPKDAVSLKKGDFTGRYIRFGIREHGMGGMMNGMALHGGIIPYGGTFFTFSDYMRPALRLAAISEAHSIFVFTHDSIGVGEDGPTHQPVEQMASLRAMPHMTVIRPADANETAQAWRIAIQHRHGPVALLLSRQALPILPATENVAKGAYVILDVNEPQVQFVASGSEVALALDSARELERRGIKVRVVSMPSWELFDSQNLEYRNSIFPARLANVVIEAGVSMGWHKYVGTHAAFVTLDRFGASAPIKDVYPRLGFSVNNVVSEAMKVLR